MASFDEVQFPPSISFGATGGPGFSTKVIILSSGYEARNQNWSLARAEYDISTGIKTKADMDAVIAFFYARAGKARGFRFKDWKDYQATNEPVVSIGGGNFQLVKRYTSGSITYVRTITKPVTGTVTLGGGGALDYTDRHYYRRRRRQRDVSIRRSGSVRYRQTRSGDPGLRD